MELYLVFLEIFVNIKQKWKSFKLKELNIKVAVTKDTLKTFMIFVNLMAFLLEKEIILLLNIL